MGKRAEGTAEPAATETLSDAEKGWAVEWAQEAIYSWGPAKAAALVAHMAQVLQAVAEADARWDAFAVRGDGPRA